jgi:NADP-dependent 3-hydroxy acid dehydrogenase YdfG
MVSLTNVQLSNSLISSTLPRLVAVFVGGTSGIGEITLKKFAKYSRQPRAYIVGRSQDAANRIVAECKALNPEGEYIFRKADVSLIRVVDEVCKEIKAKEETINILFLSAGVAVMDRSGMAQLGVEVQDELLILDRSYIRKSPHPSRINLLLSPSLHYQPYAPD